MTQVGKVAWFWRAFNERILEAVEQVPKESYRIMRIEDLDYARYVELCRFLGLQGQIPQATFDGLRTSRPHAFWRKRMVDQWTEREIEEFENQVAQLAERFGYESRVAKLVDEARAEKEESIRLGRIPAPKTGPRFWRARRVTAEWLRTIAKAVDVS